MKMWTCIRICSDAIIIVQGLINIYYRFNISELFLGKAEMLLNS